VRQTDDGAGCTDESHAVTGLLAGVSRSGRTEVGAGIFHASLVHHRVWVFGRCISYAASVSGTISVAF
jgi:hypothetical protein